MSISHTSTKTTGTDAAVKVFGSAFLFLGGVFIYIIIGTLTGGLAGWTVGLLFGETILGILAKLGITGVTMWQVGIFMGFFGGFLKTKVTN